MNKNDSNYLDLRDRSWSPSIEDRQQFNLEEINNSSYQNSLLNSILVKVEYFYAYFSLLFFADALSFRSYFLSGEGSGQVGFETPIDPLIGLTRYAIFAFAVVITIIRIKTILPTFLRLKFLLILALLPYLSHFWSDFPEFSSKFGFFTLGATFVGVYFAGRYSFAEQLKILAWVFGTILTLCLIFILLFPGSGIEQGMHAGAWRGVFWHKNNLGMYGAISAIFFCLMAQAETRLRSLKNLYWFACFVAVIMLVMSTSKTALIVFLATFALLICCYILRWNDLVSIPIFLSLFVLGSGLSLWFIQSIDKILVVLGKGASLSGRTDIWTAVLYYIQNRLWLGHGYAGFWVDVGQAKYVWRDIGFQAVNAHNGFLDLVLDLGLIGLSLFLLTFIFAYGKLLLIIRQTRNIKMFWPLLFLSLFLMYNFAEAQILKSSFNWIVFTTIVGSIGDLWQRERNP